MSILISGILVNPAGVPVTGAEITFTALTTSEFVLNGFSASIITNDNGEYAIPLEYCDYSISIQSDGHNTVYGAVSITEKSTPTTINELLKLAAMEQTVTPAIIVYFREIQADVAEKLAAVKALNDSAKDAANSAIAARNEAAQYAQSVNLAVAQAQQASVAAGNAASVAETAAENATETLSYYQQQLVGWQQILTGSGDVTLTAPDGQTVTVRSQQAWDAALTGKADLTQTFRKRGLLGTVDLNTITGEQDGVWTQNSNANATLAKNYPTTIAGSLLVVQGTANGNTAAHQLYFPYNTTRVYIRYFLAGGTWGTWSEIWNSASLVKQSSMYDRTTGAILVEGAYGMGASNLVQQPAVNDLTISGKYHSKGGDDYGIPTDRSLYVDVTTLAANARHQFLTDHAAGNTRRIFSRISVNNVWQPPYEFWTDKNLIKQSSSKDWSLGSVLTLASDNSGSFGLGSLAAPELGITTTLANALATARSGLYRVPVGTAGSPNTAVGWYFLVTRYSVASAGVFAYSAEIGNQQMAQGNFNNGVFNGWVNIWNSANLAPTINDQTTLNLTSADAIHTWALANSSRSFRNDGINTDASTIRFGSGAFTKVNGTYSILTAGPSASTAGVKIQAGDANGYLNYNVWTDRNLTPADMYGARGTLGTADLDTIFGQAYRGVWDQGATANATLARHYPINSAGSLEVIYNAANAVGVIQRYTTHASNRVFIRYKARDLPQDTWSAWVEYWTSDNLVKQTGQFDATAGALALNTAWGWGGAGELISLNTVAHLAWLRNASTGSRIYRNQSASSYAYQYSPSLLMRTGDTWASLSIGYGSSTIQGVFATAGANDGSIQKNYVFWTDQNLVKQSAYLAGTGEVLVAGLAGGVGTESSQLLPNATLASDFRVNGVWYAQTAQQTDVPVNGYLQNLFGNPSRNYGVQNLIDVRNNTPSFRYRTIENNNVGAWHELATLDTDQTVTGKKVFNRSSEAIQIKSLADNQSCFIRGQKADNTPHWYIGKGGADYAVAWANQHSTANNSITLREDGHIYQNVAGNKASFLSIGGVLGRILSQGHNAVVDSNGFWKQASPVVKLFANGTSELTSEAEGITTERLSEGVYRISGCLGLNADLAWGGIEGGISCPKCRNGLERIWNDYGVEADGSIVIRTYHRPHPDAPAFARNEIEGYANGDPIDIPSDTFISVRVQMPEREEPKPKAMHSNVYCGNTSSAGFR